MDLPVPVDRPAIRSVLFDLDNTLLDRDAGFLRFCHELYRGSDVISQSDTEEEAVTLMVCYDRQGRQSRQEFFHEIMSRWPGAFRNLEQASQLYVTLFPGMLAPEPSTRALLEELRLLSSPRSWV